MKLKYLIAAAIALLITSHSWIAPVAAIPGWQFIRELFTGGEPGIVGSRVGNRSDIPYLITPRKTAILTPTPRFQWHPVSMASSYTVTLRGPNGILWETTVAENQVTYTGSRTLEPDLRYSLVVRTEVSRDTGGPMTVASTDEGLPGLAFYVLPEAEVSQLNRDLAAVADEDLSALEANIMRARVYREYNLMSDAIALLESHSTTGENSVAVYRLLGELYLQVGLNLRARTAFSQARELALETGERSEQADANAFLAHIALGERDPDTAIQLLNEAQALYVELDDPIKAKEVSDWLEAL